MQKERDAKEARQLDFEIKRQQGREAKQELFRRRELERREQSKESTDGEINSKEQKTQSSSSSGQQGTSSSDGQQQQQPAATTTARKHKLQIIQSLRQESSTESDTQSYTEFRG